jgi:hypothetical protein
MPFSLLLSCICNVKYTLMVAQNRVAIAKRNVDFIELKLLHWMKLCFEYLSGLE